MPFLLIVALLIAVIASPTVAAEAASPQRLPHGASTHAVPITPGGGIHALRTAVTPVSTSGLPASTSSPPVANGADAINAADAVAPHTDPHTATNTATVTKTTPDAATPQRPAGDTPIRLSPRTRGEAGARDGANAQSSPLEQREKGRSTWIATTIGGLGIALGAFLLLAWMIRRSVPAAMRPLSGDVVEVLGRTALAGRQQLHVLHFANKLVLISTTPSGDTISLAEIEDSDEVSRIVALCRQHDSQSSSESFRRLLQQFGQEPTERGFVDVAADAPAAAMPSHLRPIDQQR